MTSVTTNQLFSLVRRQQQVLRHVEDGGLTIENALVGTQGILDGIYPPLRQPTSLPDWYEQPEQQVARVVKSLARFGVTGGMIYIPSDIPPIPTNFVPRTSTEVLMLMVYLPDKSRSMKGVRLTFDRLWGLVVPPVGYSKWRWESLKSDSSNLRLLPGIEHRPGIRWVAFDPNTNQGKSPKSCWENPNSVSTLAGPEVLMAAWLFPKWVASWNGDESPFANMAGYQFKWESAWQGCPCIYRWDGPRQLELNARWAGNANDGWACPSVREC
jgi:hypothetical protein